MKLASYGEDRLIADLTHALVVGKDVRVGVGDDCAVIGRARDPLWLLLKTDAVVEGVHFLPDENPARVGWKALARAISDIAAMGGEPRHALITLAVSRDVEVARMRALYAGLRKAARKFHVSIVGGETSRSPGPLFLSIALTGEVERARCVLRSGGRAGDILFVTGELGGSIAARHLDFTPRVAEARWLTGHFRLRAMMDLSDGLAADLPRLAAASRCGYTLDESLIPRTPGCTLAQSLADGEDYELLFALAPRDAARLEREWPKAFPNLRLTRVGLLAPLNSQPSIVPTVPRTSRKASNLNLPRGFDHFA